VDSICKFIFMLFYEGVPMLCEVGLSIPVVWIEMKYGSTRPHDRDVIYPALPYMPSSTKLRPSPCFYGSP
jgi:hypothetical protein